MSDYYTKITPIKMRIETERLIVRSFEEKDAEALYRVKTDKEVMKYIPDFLGTEVSHEDITMYIKNFRLAEDNGIIDTWRCYAIENKNTGEVMGTLSFGKSELLFEYELGWEMTGEYTKQGYASEAAAAFAEYFCEKYGVPYIIAIMDIDNPASQRTAEKSGFRLFEKRTVYDYSLGRYSDDYFYFRRYYSKCGISNKFYGDKPYTGRG